MIILRQKEFGVGKSNPSLNFLDTKGNKISNKNNARTSLIGEVKPGQNPVQKLVDARMERDPGLRTSDDGIGSNVGMLSRVKKATLDQTINKRAQMKGDGSYPFLIGKKPAPTSVLNDPSKSGRYL